MQNFAFKFRAVAEKTAKNVRGYCTLFCHTLYIRTVHTTNAIAVMFWFLSNQTIFLEIAAA